MQYNLYLWTNPQNFRILGCGFMYNKIKYLPQENKCFVLFCCSIYFIAAEIITQNIFMCAAMLCKSVQDCYSIYFILLHFILFYFIADVCTAAKK